MIWHNLSILYVFLSLSPFSFAHADCELKPFGDAKTDEFVGSIKSLFKSSDSCGTRVFNLHTDTIPITQGRKQICTMTLNSPAEKEAFIKHSKSNSDAADYIELAPPGKAKSRNEWLQSTCGLLKAKNVNCDELILSAHFGPRLYGEGRKEIDLEFLEKMSCDSSCSNLFTHLKKTYLFACNTLSGNRDDHRRADNQTGLNKKEKASSQQNYVVIQMAHDASRSWAEEASESRYGKYGDGGGFGDRFLRIFSNSVSGSEIYGFTSVDDRGTNNAQFIQQSFSQHQPLESVMKNANMIKKTGNLNPESSHLKTVSCQLSKFSDDPDAVMNNITDYYLTKDPYRAKLYPKMIRFIMDHYTDHHTIKDDEVTRPGIRKHSWMLKLSSNDELKKFVLGALNEPVLPSSTRMNWSSFAAELGWISRPALDKNLAQGLYGLMRPPYNIETEDDVLHFAKIYPESISAMRLDNLPSNLSLNPSAKARVKELLRSIDSINPPGRLDAKLRNWANKN